MLTRTRPVEPVGFAQTPLATKMASKMSGHVYAAAVELGIDTENESRFFAIAREMCDESSVPEEWNMYFDDNNWKTNEKGEWIFTKPSRPGNKGGKGKGKCQNLADSSIQPMDIFVARWGHGGKHIQQGRR